MKNDHLFGVILAGGGGTRLWPKSRKATPKQFLKLTGKDTMMQVSAQRLAKLVPWERMIVVTNESYIDEVKKQLPEIPAQQIIAEPARRETAMAMLVGARMAQLLDPEAVVINAASDHVVQDEAEFVRVMKVAAEMASRKKHLVTVGITPTYPATGFGYIKINDELDKINRLPIFKVESFTEKPNQATARAFISTGKYFWNANMYVWAAQTLEEAFQKHAPEMLKLVTKHSSISQLTKNLPSIYDQVPSISIDYAISEKADNLILIPGDFGWEDIGEWKVVYDLGKKNLHNNVVMGEGENVHSLAVNSHGNLVHTNGRLVALVGVEDMIVVDTDEIVLIAPQSHSQNVKKLVERLKEEGMDQYL